MQRSDSTPLKGYSILVLDDEDLVREVACMIIRENGGEVLATGEGEDALDVVDANPNIACVVLDYSMPGMTGYQVFCELEKRRPGLPAVFVSGLTVVPEVAELQGRGRVALIAKPFGEQELIGAIMRVLELSK